MIILLDTGVLGLLVHTSNHPAIRESRVWFRQLGRSGAAFVVPTIVDYELRRGLIYSAAERQLANLDLLMGDVTVPALSDEVLRRAAYLWADLRRRGLMTGSDQDLGADVMIGAHAQLLAGSGEKVVVATNNVRHLARLCDARNWREVQPS